RPPPGPRLIQAARTARRPATSWVTGCRDGGVAGAGRVRPGRGDAARCVAGRGAAGGRAGRHRAGRGAVGLTAHRGAAGRGAVARSRRAVAGGTVDRGAGRGRAQTEGALRGGELLLGTVHVDETSHADEETDEQDAPPQRAAAAAAEAPDVDEDTDDEDARPDERRPAGAGVPGLGDRCLRGSGRRRPVRARGRVGGGAVRRLRGPVGAGARRRDGLRGRVVDPELPALRRRRPRRVGLPVGGRGEAGRDVPPRGRVESLSHSATVTLRRRPASARRRGALPIRSWDDAVVTDAPPPWTRHYQPGVPARIELPTESLVELYERSVAEAGSAVATEVLGRETSYAELGDQIARASPGLRGLGVRAGDRVALVLPNCPQHIVAFYAVLRLGAVVVEHNPLYTARELRHMFEDHGARVVIAWDAAVAKLREQPSDIE